MAFTKPHDHWGEFVEDFMRDGITDLVIYRDTRPFHKAAIDAAKELGIRVHRFEEGYLRSYWCTYERGGVNGYSRLMNMSVEQMREGLQFVENEQPEAPARWGDMRQHILLGAVYHW